MTAKTTPCAVPGLLRFADMQAQHLDEFRQLAGGDEAIERVDPVDARHIVALAELHLDESRREVWTHLEPVGGVLANGDSARGIRVDSRSASEARAKRRQSRVRVALGRVGEITGTAVAINAVPNLLST